MTREKKRQFVRLGYSNLDTAEILKSLNQLMADYQVLYHKLQNYHWNIRGGDFYELHENFGAMYQRIAGQIDQIAGKIKLFGKYPLSTMKEYLSVAQLSEGNADFTSIEMVKDIVNDLTGILSVIEEGIYSAQNISDFGTEEMLKSFIRVHEKEYWQFSAWLNQSIVKS